jgi:hypothetical protein
MVSVVCGGFLLNLVHGHWFLVQCYSCFLAHTTQVSANPMVLLYILFCQYLARWWNIAYWIFIYLRV